MLLLRRKWDLRSFGILRSAEWQFCADVSGQSYRSRNFLQYFHYTLRKLQKQPISGKLQRLAFWTRNLILDFRREGNLLIR